MTPSPQAPHRRLAVLASGRGSNLAALVDAVADHRLNADLVGVFSDRPDCAALAIATSAGIPTWSARPNEYPDRARFDEALFAAIRDVQPELILCAGYMRIIGARQVEQWTGRMINLHPSLLPAYPGLHTHARALADGVREHGASVHFVTAELDGGPVIAQTRLMIEADDTADSLAQRLQPREHALLLAVSAELCDGRIGWEQGRVVRDRQPLRAPLLLDASNQLGPAAR